MQIFEKLCEIITEHFGVDASTLTPKTEFVGDLGADSLDVVELALGVEEAFSLPEIQEDDLKALVTIDDLCDYVSDRIGG